MKRYQDFDITEVIKYHTWETQKSLCEDILLYKGRDVKQFVVNKLLTAERNINGLFNGTNGTQIIKINTVLNKIKGDEL